MVFWDVGVGGVGADDVDDGGVGVAGVVDGVVAVVEDAVGGVEDGGEVLVGDVLGCEVAYGHASADLLFHDHVKGGGWWKGDVGGCLWCGDCCLGVFEAGEG